MKTIMKIKKNLLMVKIKKYFNINLWIKKNIKKYFSSSDVSRTLNEII